MEYIKKKYVFTVEHEDITYDFVFIFNECSDMCYLDLYIYSNARAAPAGQHSGELPVKEYSPSQPL